eukprot:241339-Prymnesium_polylepis.1
MSPPQRCALRAQRARVVSSASGRTRTATGCRRGEANPTSGRDAPTPRGTARPSARSARSRSAHVRAPPPPRHRARTRPRSNEARPRVAAAPRVHRPVRPARHHRERGWH